MKKNILLLAPHFMGYDEIIRQYLSCKYNVIYIDTEKTLHPLREKYKTYRPIARIAYKLLPELREKVREDMFDKKEEQVIYNDFCDIKFDYILVINGDAISNRLYTKIFDSNSDAFSTLFIWDDVKCLFKKKQFSFFDHIYSYNIIDCKKYGFEFLPVFTEPINKDYSEKKYDIAIVATANKERIRLAKKIYQKYKDKYKFFIYFFSEQENFDFFTYNTPMPYLSYMDILAQSKAVLEHGRHGQNGPTTRIYDAIETKTKVITTNKYIKHYPIYNDNILIINKTFKIPERFITDPYVVDTSYKSVSIQEWCEKLLEVVEYNDK